MMGNGFGVGGMWGFWLFGLLLLVGLVLLVVLAVRAFGGGISLAPVTGRRDTAAPGRSSTSGTPGAS